MPGKALWRAQAARDSALRGLGGLAFAQHAERGPCSRLSRVVADCFTPTGADSAGALHGIVCAA
jgi:hypothetical protein